MLLACAELPGGRGVEAIARRGGGAACVELYVARQRLSRGCFIAPSQRRPIPRRSVGPGTIYKSRPGAQVEAYAGARATVERLIFEFHRGGSKRTRRATELALTDPEALQRAGIPEGFKIFLARLPPGSCRASARATGDDEDLPVSVIRFFLTPTFTVGPPPDSRSYP